MKTLSASLVSYIMSSESSAGRCTTRCTHPFKHLDAELFCVVMRERSGRTTTSIT